MTYIPLTGASSGGSKPSNWTVRDRLRNITKTLTAGSSLDLRFAEKFFYQNDALYPAMELMATHSRTSSAWYPNWDFRSGSAVGRLVEYAANERRYGDYGALDEGASTNHISNPRGEGGDANTAPTGWNLTGSWASIATWEQGTLNGWPYTKITFNGTPSSPGVLSFADTTDIAASEGQDWSTSIGIALASGDLTNITSVYLRHRTRDNAGSNVAASDTADLQGSFDTENRRFVHSSNVSGSSVAYILPQLIFGHSSGAVNFSIYIFAPQVEQAGTASSPILPTVDTPAMATRAADVVTSVATNRASLGWYDSLWDFTNGGECGDLLEFLPDVPRVGPKGLLVEAGSTNQIRNPRGEGAVVGAPGTAPDYWTVAGGGVTSEIVSSGVRNGWPYVRVRFSGTLTGNNIRVIFEETTQIVAADGEDWTFSIGLQLAGGDLTNIAEVLLATVERDDAGALSLTNLSTAVTVDGLHRRLFYNTTLSGGASTASVRPEVRFEHTSGAVDFTVDFIAPQLEQKAFPTSAILPDVGTPAAATRADDDIYIESGEWASDSEFSVYCEASANTLETINSPVSFAVDGADRTSVRVDEGGTIRFRYRSDANTDVVQVLRSSEAGEVIRSATGVDASEVAISINGASTQTYTPTDLYTAAQFSFGREWPDDTVGGSVFVTAVRYWPYKLPISELEALVA